MSFLIFLAGCFVGATIGIFALAIVTAGRDDNDE